MSKHGYHVSAGGRTGFGDSLKTCSEAASPVSLLVSLDQDLSVDRNSFSPSTPIIFRTQPNGDDFPSNLYSDPVNSAHLWMSHCLPVWQKNPADYYSPVNEPNPTESQWSSFALFLSVCMDIAAQNGLKLCLGNLSTGTPSDDGGSSLEQKIYEMGLDFWGKVQAGGHIWGTHEYGFSGTLQSSAPFHALRYRRTRDWLKSQGITIKFAVTELGGWSGGYYEGWIDDLAWYDSQVMTDPLLIGTAIYQIGGAENIAPHLPDLTAYISANPSPVLPPVQNRYYVPFTNMNIRQQPNTSSRIMGILSVGRSIQIEDTPIMDGHSTWYQIAQPGAYHGYFVCGVQVYGEVKLS